MTVAFMRLLEKIPEHYESEFDRILEGRATSIRERIVALVRPGLHILDLGCGTGLLAAQAAERGASVIGVDSNKEMLKIAEFRTKVSDSTLQFVLDKVNNYLERTARAIQVCEQNKFDMIVSTFLLSELKPIQRHVLLRRAREVLVDDGLLVLAAEVLPKDRQEKRDFWKKRHEAERRAGLYSLLSKKHFPPPIEDLEGLVTAAGFKIKDLEQYGPEIVLVIARKTTKPSFMEFQQRVLPYNGLAVRARMIYDLIPGSWRGIPIPPGLYKRGRPTAASPVIVTANYELTYYRVMRTLEQYSLDAWVLVCDTDGINVWCAARGSSFKTDDVVDMVFLTQLDAVTTHRELILPQLSAAGVNAQEVHRRTRFRAHYGPIRIEDLPQWLEMGMPRPKPRGMATVTFPFRERMRQAFVHIPFLMRQILFWPLAATFLAFIIANLGLAIINSPYRTGFAVLTDSVFAFIVELILALFGYALVLGIVFPILPTRGNSYFLRGLGLAVLTMPIGAIIMFTIGVSQRIFVSWLIIQFILSVCLTLDWSGLTPLSDPKVIRKEYHYLVRALLLGSLFLVGFNLIAMMFGW